MLTRCGVLTLTLLSSPCLAAQQTIICPTELAPSSLQLTPAMSGWTYFAEAPVYLHGAAPLAGPPESRAHLIHSSIRHGKDEVTYTYVLDGPSPNGKWMQCAYGEHHALTLSMRLADETDSCQITQRKGSKAGQYSLHIVCSQP
ncbi:STY0301 family protein [Pseudoduganella ginsengisoli]